MRTPQIFHPEFAKHPRQGLNTSMTDRIEIYKPTGDGTEINWVPGAGVAPGTLELVYRGPARVQPNIDWRARDRDHAGELDATEAVRVQWPIGGNELGDDVLVAKDYQVKVLSSAADASPWLTQYNFVVRNGLEASQKWLFTALADVGTKIVG